MNEKRVQFDFEIAFSNGGGLRGWDFRLDIYSEVISDQELADYIVSDMRLLLVQKVMISKKRSLMRPIKAIKSVRTNRQGA